MEIYRTFIALELSAAVKKSLARVQQRIGSKTGGIKWVKPENMHLTLKFLGATAADKISAVAAVLSRAAAGVTGFPVSVSGFGAFPSRNNPKVVWAGLETGDVLLTLQKEIDLRLEPLGFQREKKPFSPHLTLGRVRDAKAKKVLRTMFEKIPSDPIGSFTVEQLTFYKSELMPQGPVYGILKQINL